MREGEGGGGKGGRGGGGNGHQLMEVAARERDGYKTVFLVVKPQLPIVASACESIIRNTLGTRVANVLLC